MDQKKPSNNLGISLSKDVKDLYSENYKTLKKETADDTSKWKHILSSLIGRINIIKITLLFLNKGSIRLPITTYKQVPKTKVGGEGKRYLLKDCIN